MGLKTPIVSKVITYHSSATYFGIACSATLRMVEASDLASRAQENPYSSLVSPDPQASDEKCKLFRESHIQEVKRSSLSVDQSPADHIGVSAAAVVS